MFCYFFFRQNQCNVDLRLPDESCLVANIGDSIGADTRSLRKIRISAVVATVVINLHHIQVTPEVKTHFLSDIKIFVKICMKYSTLWFIGRTLTGEPKILNLPQIFKKKFQFKAWILSDEYWVQERKTNLCTQNRFLYFYPYKISWNSPCFSFIKMISLSPVQPMP